MALFAVLGRILSLHGRRDSTPTDLLIIPLPPNISILPKSPPSQADDISRCLDNHLRDTLSTQGLAADERLALDTRSEVAECRQSEEHSGSNQSAGAVKQAEEDNDGHDGVGGGAHVVRGDLADGIVEFRGGWADAEEKGNFDEEDQEGEDTGGPVRESIAGKEDGGGRTSQGHR